MWSKSNNSLLQGCKGFLETIWISTLLKIRLILMLYQIAKDHASNPWCKPLSCNTQNIGTI